MIYNIVDEIAESFYLYNVTDETGSLWQTVGHDEKEALSNIRFGGGKLTFLIKPTDSKSNTDDEAIDNKNITNELTVENLIDDLNIPRKAIVLIAAMEVVLESINDKRDFIDRVRQDSKKSFNKVLMEMRKEKIRTEQITKNQFLKLYSDNKELALQTLFKEKIHGNKLIEIEIENSDPNDIYNFHKENPFDYLSSFLLSKPIKREVRYA